MPDYLVTLRLRFEALDDPEARCVCGGRLRSALDAAESELLGYDARPVEATAKFQRLYKGLSPKTLEMIRALLPQTRTAPGPLPKG